MFCISFIAAPWIAKATLVVSQAGFSFIYTKSPQAHRRMSAATSCQYIVGKES